MDEIKENEGVKQLTNAFDKLIEAITQESSNLHYDKFRDNCS